MSMCVCVCVFAEMLLFTPPCVVFSLSQLQSAELQRLEGHRSTLSARTKRRLECRRSNEISGLSSKGYGIGTQCMRRNRSPWMLLDSRHEIVMRHWSYCIP